MPLYEFKEGSSSKFWEITLSGNSFTTRWGKIGTKGQEKTQSFSNAIEAKREHDKLIAEKTKKGYELAEGQEAPAEDEDGGDSSNLAKRNPELEAAIEKDPDNVEGYLVYGDWLQSQGDPRGELIALQCAAHQASGEEATTLKRQASALVRKYKKYLLGTLADKEDNEVDVGWRFGFIQSARLARGDFDSEFDVPEAVTRLMALPSARFLRELTVGMVDFEGENYYGGVIGALAETKCPTLEKLFLGDFEYPDETEISWSYVEDISPLYTAFPRLRSLKLRGGSLKMGEVNLPELREFTVESGGVPLEAVQSLVKANWPKLERLEVWFGAENYGAGGGVDDIQPLLDGKGVPALKHLGLRNAEFTNELCKALPRAKILSQLETLDLSMGTMTDEGAEALAANAAAFKHLKRLDVTENLLSDESQKRMAALGEHVAHGNQRDDDGDEEYRYVAVGE
ncbi:MAG TPA: WGR domain-containing protein [Cystobacter sp.]